MGLTPGTKLGPYQIGEPLGAGGMGEVYRALDTRLDRAVAVKILPTHLSADPDLRQRFDREARAISSLQHPNICTLFDVGHQDGTDFLVMELLEGETLAERLQKGPVAIPQALRIAIDVADALEKAHRQGIVHRDLKPGNIMVSKAGTKLMDFGLAKPAATLAASASAFGGSPLTPTTPTSPTIAALAAPSSPITGRGMVVGTFQYIAPEVLQGEEANPRSDIFSFGAVLYEMLTGQRAFEGKSQLSVASAILEKEPAPVSSIQPMTPPALEQVVKICLAKDPEERFQTAHDLKLQLKWIAEASTSQLAAPAQVRARRVVQKRTLMIAAALGWLVAAIAALAFLFSQSNLEQARRSVTASWMSPTGTVFASVAAGAPALSPDGAKLAFLTGSVAFGSGGGSETKLWIRDIATGTVQAIEAGEQPTFPFWSPDGKFIGFFSGGKLKKIAVAGGPVQVICDAAEGRGASWSGKGVIIFTPNIREALYKVPEGGGTPEKITQPQNGWTHRNPYVLPD
ncbi:MAG TPA: protein kinase, partial [Terriglobales bacterium]|nr:protein kinase [Terriglobales bacterium]